VDFFATFDAPCQECFLNVYKPAEEAFAALRVISKGLEIKGNKKGVVQGLAAPFYLELQVHTNTHRHTHTHTYTHTHTHIYIYIYTYIHV
jgi:hypothetical protein